MQFIVTGYDGKDEGAKDRRLAAREAHLKSVEKRAAAGEHLYAAAILDDNGNMAGSLMIVEYPSREELEKWLKEEPYVVSGVWKEIDIKECSVAPIFAKGKV